MKRTGATRTPPTGLGRTLLRLPILLYRARLGWLLGGRFVLIEHIGRTTGQPRHTVVEVVDHHTADDSYIVASGFGATAHWYRNLLAHPRATIQVGRRSWGVALRFTRIAGWCSTDMGPAPTTSRR